MKIIFRNEKAGHKFLGEPLVPKSLWMTHYAHLLLDFGPLSLMETNIAEIKNGQLRKLSTKANQTKNVCHTIATR